jgi:hypothetical protein
MYSLKHVLWRGAMALSLLALGIGGGFGFQQEPLQASQAPACEDGGAHSGKGVLVVDGNAIVVTRVAVPARG